MNENVIIRSEPYNIKKICRTIMLIFVIIGFVWAFIEIQRLIGFFDPYEWLRHGHKSEIGYALSYIVKVEPIYLIPLIIPMAFGGLLCGIVSLYGKTELVVSDKRIYGRAAFGKRVDLPIDSVSAIGMSIFKGISFGTSSGKIFFSMIKNRDDIHKAVSELIIQRQTKTSEPAAIEQKPAQSGTQELRELKKLLDDGIITQEEFDMKKKQLLGL